jgi:hypothetical protein
MSQPLLALALYFFVRARKDTRNVIYASIPLALSVACRPTNIVFGAALLIYTVWHHRTQVRQFLIFPVILGTLLLTYNLYYFGSLVGAYSTPTLGSFTYPRLEGFLGLLISPSRGLLVYSPFLVFTLAGMVLKFRRGGDPLYRYLSIASILLLFLYSAWSEWHASFSYSYRFLVDLLPVLCLFLPTTWNWILAHWWRKGLFVTLATFSILIQIIGSFYYPCGWFETPVGANRHPERYWDWQDPEFLRCLRAGPVNPEGLRFVREMIHR